jgi:transposase-like protein
MDKIMLHVKCPHCGEEHSIVDYRMSGFNFQDGWCNLYGKSFTIEIFNNKVIAVTKSVYRWIEYQFKK